MNRSVVAALADRVADLIGSSRAQQLAQAITSRQEADRFPPEYQAEVIVRRLRGSYFQVLQSLDSDTPNDVHLRIAALAKCGHVPAVVTTNFDRALEAAFRQVGVPFEVWSDPAAFETTDGRWRDVGRPGRPCPIVKLHGSAESPSTLVDTLSQRRRGFAPNVSDCVRQLLRLGHWLFLGYSGADLMADENYLFLKPDAAEAQGFTWLVRDTEQVVPVVSSICALYDGRAEIVHGELPSWLSRFSMPLLQEPVPVGPTLTAEEAAEVVRRGNARVAVRTRDWALSERFDRIALVFADLLDAVGEPAAGLEVVQRLYDRQPPDERHSGHFGLVVDSLANAYSRVSRFDDAVVRFQEAIEIFDPSTYETQHLGAMNNLALVYEKQGRSLEALQVYERVLEFVEEHRDQDGRGVALHNIGMVRASLGDYDEAERLYKQELDIVQELGDESARAQALNNLGNLEVSRRRFDVARGYLDQALAIFDRIGDDLGAAHCRGNLANVNLLEGSYRPALQLHEQNFQVFERFGNRSDALRTLSNIARIKEDTGQRGEAIALLDEVLADPVSEAAPSLRVQALQLLGDIQQGKGEMQASADTFEELIGLSVSIHDVRNERDARVGRGIALKALGNFGPATEELRKTLELTADHGLDNLTWVVESLADALNRNGLEHEENSDFESAIPLFLEASALWRGLESPFNEGQTLRNLGNTYAQHQQLAEAASTFQQSSAALLIGNDRTNADEVAMTAGELYLLLGRLQEASQVFRAIVTRSENFEERVISMNRMGQLSEMRLQGGDINGALWLQGTLAEWNQQDGYPEDAAACLLNIGIILKRVGERDQARRAVEQAISLLADVPAHPLLTQARDQLASIRG